MTRAGVCRLPADQAVRDRALAPASSFIVQAPAGSGKTGLLTQRYLTLLAHAEVPEEIVAITFTRKAAGEMRDRILNALRLAGSASEASLDGYLSRTLALGEAALLRSEAQGWELLSNPGRLRIQTIDSLCLELARQMPVLSQFGALPATVEAAHPLYMEAAAGLLAEIDRDDRWGYAAAALLQHLDNDQPRMQELIAGMLARRDQWLRHLGNADAPQLDRDRIEAALRRVVQSALGSVRDLLPPAIGSELCELARFAAGNLDVDSMLARCRELTELPDPLPQSLPAWLGLTGLLLTQSGDWRKPKGVNVRLGFPALKTGEETEKARYSAMKKRMQELLLELGGSEELRLALQGLRSLPQPAYTEQEWSLLEALFLVLLRAVTQLMVVFGQRGEMDFIEAALRANRALGEEESPTDLALRLDYQLRHLLVDEFQDTSQNQFDLFLRLTRGWERGDGRTLFLVGDPMQSIYRFREAEVGLFLQAWREGLGEVALEPLRLEANFRSQAGIVEWVNSAFPQVLPVASDAVSGAVRYAPFGTWLPAEAGSAVTVHPFVGFGPEAEADQVMDIVRKVRTESPDDSIAVLVRARRHLASIVTALDAARRQGETEFDYQAVEISPLASRQPVLDLLALTRALLHPADRIAWLALLRAPFCGLALIDLHLLADSPQQVLPERLRGASAKGDLSKDGRVRLTRISPVLEAALADRDRRSLRQWVEGTWLALGGPACITNTVELEDVEAYLRLLEELADSGEVVNAAVLAEKLKRLYARPAGRGVLQLMTMHKAKGLEFDTVILPGLGRSPPPDRERLLYWLEQRSPAGAPELLFGPIRMRGEQKNATAAYIGGLEQMKEGYEAGRLLYVAATRARRRLHLLGQVAASDGGEPRPPARRSLLNYLWPAVREQFVATTSKSEAMPEQESTTEEETRLVPRLRLPADWRCPSPPVGVVSCTRSAALRQEAVLDFDWAGEVARQSGVAAHRLLQHLAARGLETKTVLDRYPPMARRMLLQAGIGGVQLEMAIERVMAVLQNTLEDPRGRWILARDRHLAENEAAVTAVVDGELRHLVIDRTFVDEEGVRWVIDYKSGSHEGGDVARFLQQEVERYRGQLERYARAVSMLEPRPVKMGLYFPLLRGWREWSLSD